MSYSSDYSPLVGSGGCSYSTLGTYNQGYYGRGIAAPVPATVGSMEVITVPVVDAPGYDALTHGAFTYPYMYGSGMTCESGTCGILGNCSGYFGIRTAYPSYPNNCSKFTSRLCS